MITTNDPRLNAGAKFLRECACAAVVSIAAPSPLTPAPPPAMAMPMAVWPHVMCFDKWQAGAAAAAVMRDARTMCPDLLPRTVPSPDDVSLVFGPNAGVRPDDAAVG